MYLAEAGVGTGPPASFGVSFLIWKSPQEHLDRCVRLKPVERFGESEVPSLRSGVRYRLTELLQTGWLTRWVWSN